MAALKIRIVFDKACEMDEKDNSTKTDGVSEKPDSSAQADGVGEIADRQTYTAAQCKREPPTPYNSSER